VPFDEDIIDKDMDRSKHDFEKMAVVKKGTGKSAVSYYRVLERFDGFTFVEVAPKTGRTHQIRVHMASIGHPCLADSSYGRRDALFLRDLGATEDPLVPDPQQPILMRQALHAFQIQFTHPATGMTVTYSAPLAEDLERVLTLLRKYRSKERPPAPGEGPPAAAPRPPAPVDRPEPPAHATATVPAEEAAAQAGGKKKPAPKARAKKPVAKGKGKAKRKAST